MENELINDINKMLKEIRHEKKELEKILGNEKNKSYRYLLISQRENELNKAIYLENYKKRKDFFENKMREIEDKEIDLSIYFKRTGE